MCQCHDTWITDNVLYSRNELVREVALVLGVGGVGVERALGLLLVEEVGEAWVLVLRVRVESVRVERW